MPSPQVFTRRGQPASLTSVVALLVIGQSLALFGCRASSLLSLNRSTPLRSPFVPFAPQADRERLATNSSNSSRVAVPRPPSRIADTGESWGESRDDRTQVRLASDVEELPPGNTEQEESGSSKGAQSKPFDLKKGSGGSTGDSASATLLNLNQTILASLNQHPAIAAGLESVRQAEADYWTSTLKPNPQLFMDAQLLPLTRPFTVTKQGGPPQQDVVLSYPIDWFLFGKRAAAMTSAHYQIHVSEADFQELVRQRVLLTATSYFDVLEYKGFRDLAKETVENLERIEQLTSDAVAQGARPAVELSRIRLDLLAAQQTLRTSEAEYLGSLARLRAVVGIDEVVENVKTNAQLADVLDEEPLPAEDAVELAIRGRPDLNSLRWLSTAYNAETYAQMRNAKPTITPSFGYTRQYQRKAIGFPDADSWSAGVNVSLPLHDRNQGNIAKADSSQRQAALRYQAAIMDVRADVEQAIAGLVAAKQNARVVASDQIRLATQVRDSITESYEVGGRPLIDVLDAQRNFREINRLYVASRAAYWRALFQYYAAIGRRPESP